MTKPATSRPVWRALRGPALVLTLALAAWLASLFSGILVYPAAMLGVLGVSLGLAVLGEPWCRHAGEGVRAVIMLAWTLATLATMFAAVSFIFLLGMFGEDHSADEWSVPPGLEVNLPGQESFGFGEEAPDNPEDPFLDALLNAQEESDSTAYADTRLPILTRLANTGELERRLARSPRWRVHEERGHRYASRLLPVRGRYHVELNDFYSDRDLHRTYDRTYDRGRFQVRLSIGLDGHARVAERHLTELRSAASVVVPTGPGQLGQIKSWIAVRCGPVVVEVFEESNDSGRARTLAALATIERELAVNTAETTSATPVTPGLVLHHGMQGGIYEMEAWVDTDSPGTAYVQAFEVTSGTRLSGERIMERTRTRVHGEPGGALQPVRAEFTIYEGDWGHHYAARIELWFAPDDGGAERKLLERVYQVEGWMR